MPRKKNLRKLSKRASQKRFLEALIKSNFKVLRAARLAGIDPRTHYRWLKSDEVYQKKFEEVRILRFFYVEEKLIEGVEEKNSQMTIYFMRTQGKDFGYGYEKKIIMNTINSNNLILPEDIRKNIIDGSNNDSGAADIRIEEED